ncbi:hypothetical protein [Lactobacillus panisapium]|nr:hypothetical protein [Lactobacillus panisapium]
MTKYSSDYKSEICSKYLAHQETLASLEREYGLPSCTLTAKLITTTASTN